MTDPSNIVPFSQIGNEEWIEGYYQACLIKLNEATIDAYRRILRQFMEWAAKRPGHGKHFQPDQLTATVVEVRLPRFRGSSAPLVLLSSSL